MLSEIQLATSPFATGTDWREWWLRHGHKPVDPADLRAWLARVVSEAESGSKELLDQRRQEAKQARKRIR